MKCDSPICNTEVYEFCHALKDCDCPIDKKVEIAEKIKKLKATDPNYGKLYDIDPETGGVRFASGEAISR